MIKDNQIIKITVTPTVYDWYVNLGYNVKLWDTLEVSPDQLPPTSHHKIIAICEVCGQEKNIEYRYYYNHVQKYQGYHCPKCTAHLEEVSQLHRESMKKALLDKYGVENPIYIKGVTEKMKTTCQKRYGVDYSTQSEQMKQKSKQTLERLGKIRTSKPQEELFNLLKENSFGAELNVSEGPYSLDCKIIINEIKIDIEYDGAFWHQNFAQDRQRDGYLKKHGYKILRIRGGVNVPPFDSIQEKINILLTTNSKYEEIIMPEWDEFFKKIAKTT